MKFDKINAEILNDYFKNFACRGNIMYQKPDYAQTDIYDLILPFGEHLDENNGWVILRESIDWKIIHEVYEKNFDSKDAGNCTFEK